MIHLITGYAGSPHITAPDSASLNTGIFGSSDVVLNVGQCFKTTVTDNNHIKVHDGDAVVQGRHIRIPENSYENVTLTNGTQGYKRHDLIVIRYSRDSSTNEESASLVVLKGEASNAPVDPSYTSGNIRESSDDLIREFPLYRVVFNGIVIEAVEPLFDVYKAFDNVFNGRGLCNRNILINPWFRINQKGGNDADCWKVINGVVTITRTEIQNFCEMLFVASGSAVIGQILETPAVAGTYTVSVHGGSTNNWSFVDGDNLIPIKLDANGYWSYTFTRATAIDRVEFSTTGEVGNSIELDAVKLERGSVSTLDVESSPDYIDELMKCQRYLYPMNSQYNPCQAVGVAFNTSSIRFLIPTPVPMKSNPTIEYKSNYSLDNVTLSYNGNTVKPTALSAYAVENGIVLNATGSGFTQNGIYALRGLSCLFKAEL